MHAEPWQHHRHERLPVPRLSSTLPKRTRQRGRCHQAVTAHGLRGATAADGIQVLQAVEPVRGQQCPGSWSWQQKGALGTGQPWRWVLRLGQRVTNRPAEGTGEGRAGAAHHLRIWSGIREILRASSLSGVLQWAKLLNSD